MNSGNPGSAIHWNEVIALYGGTFDPPHLGHREAVAGLFIEPGVRRVIILPSGTPPLKTTLISSHHRVAMARLAFGSDPYFPIPRDDIEIDLCEIDRAKRDGQPGYTYDTLLHFRRTLAGKPLAFVIGADQLRDLPRWSKFPEILGLSHWIVLERKPKGAEQAQAVLREWAASGLIRPDPLGPGDRSWRTLSGTVIRRTETPARAVSSTQIREEIGRSGEPTPYSLLPAVISYLKQNALYGTRAS